MAEKNQSPPSHSTDSEMNAPRSGAAAAIDVPAEVKTRIRAEEIFREEIRGQLTLNKKTKTSYERLKDFVNSTFGIWVLSTIVVGLFTWAYSRWTISHETAERNQRRFEMLNTEIAGRLRYVDELMKANMSPYLYFIFMTGGSTLGSASSGGGNGASNSVTNQSPGVYPDFKDRPTTSLIWELKGLAPESEKTELDVALAKAEELNLIQINLLQEFLGKVREGGNDDSLLASPPAGEWESVEDMKEIVKYLLKNPHWQAAGQVSPAARAKIEQLEQEHAARLKQRADDASAAAAAQEKKDRAEQARREGFFSGKVVSLENQGGNVTLTVDLMNNSGRDVSAFAGGLTLSDALETLYSDSIQNKEVVRNGDYCRKAILLRPGPAAKLLAEKQEAMLVKVSISKIVFTDGSSEEF